MGDRSANGTSRVFISHKSTPKLQISDARMFISSCLRCKAETDRFFNRKNAAKARTFGRHPGRAVEPIALLEAELRVGHADFGAQVLVDHDVLAVQVVPAEMHKIQVLQ